MLRVGTIIITACLAISLGCTKKDEVAPAAKAKSPVAASQPAKAAQAQAPTAAGPKSDAVKGKSHYLRACAPCHGLDGSGAQMRSMMPKLGNLTSASTHARLSDNQIKNLIKNGRGKMPSLAKSLTEEQINLIVAYIRTLNKG